MNNDSAFSLGHSHFVIDPTSPSLETIFEHNQNMFGEPLSWGPQAMPIPSELSKLLEDNHGGGSSQNFSYGAFEILESHPSWIHQIIPEMSAVDLALKGSAKLVNTSSELVDQTIEASTHLARDTVQSLSESFQSQVHHASSLWNDPNNTFHNALTQMNGAVAAKTGAWVTRVNQSNVMATLKKNLSVAKGYALSVAETLSDRIEPGESLTREEAKNLAQAELRLKENLSELRDNPELTSIFETAFGDDFEVSEADALVEDVLEGVKEPEIQVVAAEKLKGEGAFGQNTIFLSEQLLTQNLDNPELLDAVLLEELGHYFDQELNTADSMGDEGAIFSGLARGQEISNAQMERLKGEDDHSVLALGDQTIQIENYYLSDAEKIEIAQSTSTPVDGSDRRLYLQAGTVEAFDAALAAQQQASTEPPDPVVQTPVDGSDRKFYIQAGTVDQFDAALADQQDSDNSSANVESSGSVTIGSSNDTLSAIASRYGIQWTDLRKPNGEAFTEDEARLLQIGDQVLLPSDPVEESVPVPANPRQADLGQPESNVSPYTGMTADAAEAWIQSADEAENVPLDSAVTINAGDTLSAIAAANGVSWQELRKPNGEAFTEEEALYLQVGDQVLLPSLVVEGPVFSTSETPLTNSEGINNETEQLRHEVESLDEQIEVIGTSSPSVTQALQEELSDVEAAIAKIELEERQDQLSDEEGRLRDEIDGLDADIEALGTSSYSVTQALENEQSDLETELSPLEEELSDVEAAIAKIELEERQDQLRDDEGRLREEIDELNADIEALGTSSYSVTQALENEQSDLETELSLLEEELSDLDREQNPVELETQQPIEEREAPESEVTIDQFDDLNEKIQNWQGTDNDPILDQLVRDRNAALENLVSGFDIDFASDLENHTRRGDSFTDAYQKVLSVRSSRINNSVEKITDLLHTDRQTGWTPWTDGDREVTSEEVFEAFEILAELDDYESNAVFNTLTEEQIEKLEIVLDQGDYVESTGFGHAILAPTRVLGRATWDTGDGLLDIPRAIVAGSWTYSNSRTYGNSPPFINPEVAHLAAGAEAANDVLADGNAPILSNAVRCQRGDKLSCGMLGIEIVVEMVGGPVAARVTSVIGRVGSRLLVRFTTSNGEEIVSTITEEAAEEMIDAITKETAEEVVEEVAEDAAEQLLRNTDDSISSTFDDGAQIVHNPTVSQGNPSSELLPRFEADIESVEEIVPELGEVPSSWRETVPYSHFEGAPEINTRTVIDNIENSHNLGVQEGRRYAMEELGLSDPDYLVNPFEFHGKYGQGFDDIMRDANGNLVIVEYKGGAARLSSSQMSPEWVASRIQRMRDIGGELGNFNADILESALEQGRLRGIALSTPSPTDALPGPTRVINEWNYE